MVDAERLRRSGKRTLLFIDEIHRFNKAQQDAFLPYVERGDIILIGATTENPSFEVISALLSRSRVYALRGLTVPEIVALLQRALTGPGSALRPPTTCSSRSRSTLTATPAQSYNTLEAAAAAAVDGRITDAGVQDAMQRKVLLYDKGGEEHFNLISALHKSVRSSDADAALYWLARMMEAGEDRMYIARRIVRIAIEDIGLADPRALEQCIAAKEAVHFLGIPEGDLALAQAAIYLCSRRNPTPHTRPLGAVRGGCAEDDRRAGPDAPRNAPTRAMKQWGYGQGYQHAHQFQNAVSGMECLPESLAGRQYYLPDGSRRREAHRRATGGNPPVEVEVVGATVKVWTTNRCRWWRRSRFSTTPSSLVRCSSPPASPPS